MLATESQSLEKYSGSTLVSVRVVNVNDNAPKFESAEYNFSIVENAALASTVGSVKVGSVYGFL